MFLCISIFLCICIFIWYPRYDMQFSKTWEERLFKILFIKEYVGTYSINTLFLKYQTLAWPSFIQYKIKNHSSFFLYCLYWLRARPKFMRFFVHVFLLFNRWTKTPVHMRWFTRGVQSLHISKICTLLWACERNCIYANVNIHMCKFTPGCKFTLTRCKYTFVHVYIFY